MSCIVCNSGKKELVFSNTSDYEYGTYSDVSFSKCLGCGLIFQDPLPSREIISSFYPENYRNYLPSNGNIFAIIKKIQFQALASKILKQINNQDKEIKILDIGFGNGELLLALKEKGYTNLFGTDFSSKNINWLKNKGINVEVADTEKGLPFKEYFDLIIMNNVIEHFIDPINVLNNCKEKLKDNGEIVLITPNTNALEYPLFKNYWAGLHIPRHTFLFNDKNIRQLGQNLGFKEVKISPLSDPGQWAISLQNVLQNHRFSKINLKNGLAWYSIPLSLFFTPITFIQSIFGKSTSILCVLRK